MTTIHVRIRSAVLMAALALLPLVAASAQEIGAYVGGGVGGIRDVRRPFGGGVSGTLMFHDWIGVRADAGYYWTLEHRSGLYCVKQQNEAGPRCLLSRLASDSHFPLVDGVALLRAHIPNKGVRFEVGAGPSWVNVATRIRDQTEGRDPLPPTNASSSRAGAIAMAGILAQPQWRMPVTLEGIYAYHKIAAFGDCDSSRLNDPLCQQKLSFHELRFSLLYKPRILNR